MKRLLLLLFVVISLNLGARTLSTPDEGMWLPMLIERLNYVDMEEMGLQLTPEELYSINNSSIKDAIVGLSNDGPAQGFFCSGGIVSDKGLLFTNHHCGYYAITNLSTPEHNYLQDGFWAYSMDEELHADGLKVSFLEKIMDVTDSIVPFLSDTLSEAARAAKVQEFSSRLENEYSEDGKYDVTVKSFFGGNEYYLFVYLTYPDVRFVGAPPASIGKFGGDTDNWEWPRHTGDFSIFRVYTAPDGSPAEYSEENIPMEANYHLPVSLDGVEDGDFAMIFGYPGGTDRYMTSYGIQYNLDVFNPAIINIFGKKLEAWKKNMDMDPKVKLELASTYASGANTWKYFIGQTKGLKNLNVYDRKKKLEDKFTAWLEENPAKKDQYGEALILINKGYEQQKQSAKPLYYGLFCGLQGSELNSAVGRLNPLYKLIDDKEELEMNEAAIQETTQRLLEAADEFYKNYNLPTDMDLYRTMIKLYMANIPNNLWPEYLQEMMKKFKGDVDQFVAWAYEKSILPTKEKMVEFLNDPKFKKIEDDPIMHLRNAFLSQVQQYGALYNQAGSQITAGDRLFIAGLREMYPDKVFYPDANSTMRVTYGTVQSYFPADGIQYMHYTTLAGVMEKEDPNSEEFIVPEKLKELYKKKDYGRYAEDGKLITCFLTTHDITGGSSGSSLMNGKGELIGLAFDGNWEAMSGDIAFETELQRCINVDIRYVLFIIDKFADAQNLIDELTIHQSKHKKEQMSGLQKDIMKE